MSGLFADATPVDPLNQNKTVIRRVSSMSVAVENYRSPYVDPSLLHTLGIKVVDIPLACLQDGAMSQTHASSYFFEPLSASDLESTPLDFDDREMSQENEWFQKFHRNSQEPTVILSYQEYSLRETDNHAYALSKQGRIRDEAQHCAYRADWYFTAAPRIGVKGPIRLGSSWLPR